MPKSVKRKRLFTFDDYMTQELGREFVIFTITMENTEICLELHQTYIDHTEATCLLQRSSIGTLLLLLYSLSHHPVGTVSTFL